MASTTFRSWATRVVLVASLCLPVPAVAAAPSPADLAQAYVARVDRQLQVPAEEVVRYAQLAEEALARASIRLEQAQHIAVVDRDATVQALLLFWRSADGRYELMHATDPDALEPRLGSAQSKGCVRIPGSLNRLLDHFGVLDAEYERAAREGHPQWVLDPARDPGVDSGSYLVVVDSAREERPPWSPAPALHHRRPPK
jgi:hypothetical protein